MDTLFEIEAVYPTGVKDEWRFVKKATQNYEEILTAANELLVNNCIDPMILERFEHKIRLRQFHQNFGLYVDLPNEEVSTGREYSARFQVTVSYPSWPRHQNLIPIKRPLPVVSPHVSTTQPVAKKAKMGKKTSEIRIENRIENPSENRIENRAENRIENRAEKRIENRTESRTENETEKRADEKVSDSEQSLSSPKPSEDGLVVKSEEPGTSGSMEEEMFDILSILDEMPLASGDRRIQNLRHIAAHRADLPQTMVRIAAQLFGKWLVYNTTSPDWKPEQDDLRKMARSLAHVYPNTNQELWYRERPCNGKLYNVMKNTRNRDERLSQLRKRQKAVPWSFSEETGLDSSVEDGFCVITPTFDE